MPLRHLILSFLKVHLFKTVYKDTKTFGCKVKKKCGKSNCWTTNQFVRIFPPIPQQQQKDIMKFASRSMYNVFMFT